MDTRIFVHFFDQFFVHLNSKPTIFVPMHTTNSDFLPSISYHAHQLPYDLLPFCFHFELRFNSFCIHLFITCCVPLLNYLAFVL
jgi:hypothetical protein